MTRRPGRSKGNQGQCPSLLNAAVPCEAVAISARRRVPKMGKHKTSGQARVVLNGREHYLGGCGSVEAHERYAALVKQRLAGGKQPLRKLPTDADPRRVHRQRCWLLA